MLMRNHQKRFPGGACVKGDGGGGEWRGCGGGWAGTGVTAQIIW